MANWIKRTTKSGNKGRTRNSFTNNLGTGKTTRSTSYGTKSYRITTSHSSDGKEKVTTTWKGPLGTKRETRTVNKVVRVKKNRPRRSRNNSGCAVLLFGLVGVGGLSLFTAFTSLGFVS